MAPQNIKMLAMDVDGTLTDGKIYMGSDGEWFKVFDVKDGYAMAQLLPKMGIEPVIITGRESLIVERRCGELGIKHLYQGVADKPSVLQNVAENAGIALGEVAYMGDDLNDLACMLTVKAEGGLTACPADAASEVLARADFVAQHIGGNGAVRELVDWMSKERRGGVVR